ncbi:hypothetical protein NBRC110019_04850 [Neptunitalea chrysea]|uniref:SusE outer membrane protein domain-containing protein n=1 Tax=Neptunitalea chrysea TaxID=1647581 RepID=A0A9W6B314_9FLAO|nr:SusE domain-containing protein [Neptunitalea chrysea]GLB51446.1 hypothetical protein NBRC110019_04850 [Neptunitalea chrysea]
MKNLYKIVIGVFAIFLSTTACDDDKDIVVLDSENASIELTSTQSELELIEEIASYDIVTFNWTDPDVGFDASLDYTIYVDVSDNDFASAVTLSAGTSKTYTMVTEDLNSILVNTFELTTEEAVSIDVKVEGSLSAYTDPIVSNTTTLTVTPYSTEMDLSTTWGVVGSATTNGWDGPDLPFWQTGTDNVYVAYVTLADGEIKFRENNEWTNNYGDTGVDGTLDSGGDNIAVTAGSYKITINLNDLTYTMETYTWGLVGSATTNGWNGPDMVMEYDGTIDAWTITATLVDGEIKFRLNNDWGLNYGDSGADGTLDNGGDNIAVSAGTYLITMYLTNGTYTIDTP